MIAREREKGEREVVVSGDSRRGARCADAREAAWSRKSTTEHAVRRPGRSRGVASLERARAIAGDAQQLVVRRALSNRDVLGLARGGLLLLPLRGRLRRLRVLGRGRGRVLVALARRRLGVGDGPALARRRLAARSGSGGGVLGRVGPFDAGILGVVGRVRRGGRGRGGAARGLDVLDIEVLRDRAKSIVRVGGHRQRRARDERVVSDARNRNLAKESAGRRREVFC